MKKLMALTTILTISGAAFANGFQDPNHLSNTHQSVQQQGFIDESVIVKNVADALNAQDNTPVRIEGKIVKQLNKKHFLFKDNAGQEIEIEVNKKAWKGLSITPQDNIQIIGKVDKEWNKKEIDVKQIIKQ